MEKIYHSLSLIVKIRKDMTPEEKKKVVEELIEVVKQLKNDFTLGKN